MQAIRRQLAFLSYLFHYLERTLIIWNYRAGGIGLSRSKPERCGNWTSMMERDHLGTSSSASAHNSGTGTLGKVLSVLETVVTSDRPLRFSDILALSGQPRGTLHRQLSHLVEEGLLTQGRDLCYEPGLRLLKFAYRSWSKNQFRAVAAPHLRRLHEETGETVHLGVLRGTEIIYVDKVESRQTVRMESQIGNASPVYCTGLGKAALSVLPPVRLADYAQQADIPSFYRQYTSFRGLFDARSGRGPLAGLCL
jgi:hypothetical protein